jgi:hypothetical protein
MSPFRASDLRAALACGHWYRANEITRAELSVGPDAHVLRSLEHTWSSETNGHFGFAAQLRAVATPPPRSSTPELWQYVRCLADRVGWRRGAWWCCWAGSSLAERYPFAPQVGPRGDRREYPSGCFPLYDAMQIDPAFGFSPRDAYGESVWLDWSAIWRLVSELAPS